MELVSFGTVEKQEVDGSIATIITFEALCDVAKDEKVALFQRIKAAFPT